MYKYMINEDNKYALILCYFHLMKNFEVKKTSQNMDL